MEQQPNQDESLKKLSPEARKQFEQIQKQEFNKEIRHEPIGDYGVAKVNNLGDPSKANPNDYLPNGKPYHASDNYRNNNYLNKDQTQPLNDKAKAESEKLAPNLQEVKQEPERVSKWQQQKNETPPPPKEQEKEKTKDNENTR
jgi:hypothetical protein